MVDLPGRLDIEAIVLKALGKDFAATFKELMALLGDPPVLENITPEWWEGVIQRRAGAVIPALEQAFMGAVDAMADDVGYVFDWDLKNEAASRWAQSYAYDLVRGITDTERKHLQNAVSKYFERGQTMGDLRAEIGKKYNPVRAEMIAQTEVTRAAVEGELWGARDLQRQGVVMRAIIQTNNDDLVCPICGPLNGTEANGNYPPFHVGCRCWVNHEVVVLGKAYEMVAFKATFKLVQVEPRRVEVVRRAA